MITKGRPAENRQAVTAVLLVPVVLATTEVALLNVESVRSARIIKSTDLTRRRGFGTEMYVRVR